MGIIDVKTTGERIKAYAFKSGYSAETLSQKLGCSRSSVFKWFAGQFVPRLDTLTILASLFDVSLDDLVVYS